MSKGKEKWPLHNKDLPNPILIQGFEEMENIEANNDAIRVITNGWVPGPKAAVLRGGVNARAVLDVMQQAGIKQAVIYHREEKIPYLEDVFLSSIVGPVHTLFEKVSLNWRSDPSILDMIKSIGHKYRMLFLGAPLADSEVLPLYNKIREIYDGSITIVRGPIRDMASDEEDTIYKWIRTNTFDAGDFSLPNVLRSLKKALGKKIAVVLPSLNEEKTVRNVINTALEVKQAGIIDEVILIDSMSSDNTVNIARSCDIPVFLHPEIAAELGSYHGKGEAMFKSAFITNADILAWVDTDIESISPQFFYGLIGPMLFNHDIKFVKGYFSRPVRVEASGMELGGGRVTEILARPWINTFMPELAGYLQPLAGTVAVYRETLRKMKIPVNYGVEIAMLIQAVKNEGIGATCQVNLGEVIHRSKDVEGLSTMAFQIMQVLTEMTEIPPRTAQPNILRRVFSAHGNFEISSQRFETYWRQY